MEAAHYAVCPARLNSHPEIRCGHKEISPKVASIKVSIKVISPESISFSPLGRSKNSAMLHSTVSILLEERDGEDGSSTNREEERKRDDKIR